MICSSALSQAGKRRSGKDFATRRSLGYCALTNAGYSEKNPPADMDAALSKIVRDFIQTWAQALTAAGSPPTRSIHISRLRPTNPPTSAFCDLCIPGTSTYPFPVLLDEWRQALAQHGNPAWASMRGHSLLIPATLGRGGLGMSMEGYLGNLFNHGAVMVNIFGWGLGDKDYRFAGLPKVLTPLPRIGNCLSGGQFAHAPCARRHRDLAGGTAGQNSRKLQATFPEWLPKHGPAQVRGQRRPPGAGVGRCGGSTTP